MAEVKFELNKFGLVQLMKSSEMEAILNEAAGQIADYANNNASPNIKGAAGAYEVESAHPIRFVSIASVRATNFESRLDNSKHNTLEKAIGSVKI